MVGIGKMYLEKDRILLGIPIPNSEFFAILNTHLAMIALCLFENISQIQNSYFILANSINFQCRFIITYCKYQNT